MVRRKVAAALLAATLPLAAAMSLTAVGVAAVPDRPASVQQHVGTVSGKLVPAHGAYLGLFYGSGSIAATSARIGTTPKLHLSYFGWADDWTSAGSTARDLAADRIPVVNWEPFGVDFTDIIAGKYDSMISARAVDARNLGHPFFLDFAAEMNEDEGWGGHVPARYIAAWRHIHDIFTRRGATNIVWVWAPNCTDSDGGPTALDYYPGPAYVDWTGIDGYNWGTSDPDFVWQSFQNVFAPMYSKLSSLGKPVLIAETASDEVGGSKAHWISSIVVQLQTRFTNVRGLVWFDIDKERHWQIASSPSALSAFRSMAANPYFAQ